MNKLIVSVLVFNFIFSGCQSNVTDILHQGTDSTSNGETVTPKTDTIFGMPYGTDQLQNIEVYLPAKRTAKTKTIVYLHGGAWYAGDKEEAIQTAIYFQKKGYAYIAMNYRLTKDPSNINPAQTQDIEKLLNLVSGKQSEWNISADKICLFGASAGGNLSLLYAYKYKEDTRVKAVISASGPTDLTDSTILSGVLQPYIQAFIGLPYSKENEKAYLEASPSNYLAKNCVPTLFFHGTSDETVPYLQVVSAYNILKNDGVNVELKLFERSGHDLTSVNDEMLLDMEKFLKTAY